ncbi:response regulator, partial [Acidobacteriia bacterium AH_259_A11_L15]|nr:response regulator [Acidobacteriia bacterium AH_259_A11_L15]
PKLSGLEVCQRVRADTHLGQVAILVLSATSDPETLRTVQELGNIEFVPKPFDTQKLLEKVRTLVAP